ncbi:monocarboxylate transporter 13-like isoform X1 [Mercenaria mercenaria]|uniref:monocarboxylate transporter 13-like isoform X1 n=1 Tax=Mercenaria mercenaria TaxID=6596 RepID=UPI00234E3B2D|nr:monocarboxylate transporter 13-like isoform X1 [Mercenaria mercenaria]XP_045171729.2 monocarboxylate transporter 13-like isoform X1 [Mercenaria mercenaria]XP_045171730.2 monocarboxylate transporter 13-like isoform X1 [Mercenaria mercenaria]XP_053375159.1 monocarboxylate transporter 13-like isoform X1 [Mercenaria mercenaria]XP_053375160.1 monocarboxylate transporter 13-like isoform X1 [Mercenaria mercenaria]
MREPKRDSAWSWLVLFCVLCCQIVLGGVCLSGGLFYVIFKNVFSSDPVETSWLCSLPITMWFISTPVGSILTNRHGYRVCSFVGGILSACGLSLSFLATSSTFLFFTYGFLTGLGLGINYTGCMSALNVYFDKYKTVATGIASVGNNIGLIIFAYFIVALEESFGWRGMLLIIGGITFNLCACAVVMFPIEVRFDTYSKHNLNEKTTRSLRRKYINCSVFRKMSFVGFCASNVFFNFSHGIYILHLPSYSKDVGFNKNNFGTVLMAYGICNIVGKVFYSCLGHHPQVNVTLVYTISLTATGICMGLTPVLLTRTGMLVLAGLVGFFSCVTGALINAVIHTIVGFSRFTDGVGMSLPFKATGNLIGGPMAGFLLTATGNYAISFYLAGVSMILASCLLVHPIVHVWQREKDHRTRNINTVSEMDVENSNKESIHGPEHSIADLDNETMLNSESKFIDLENYERN